MEIKEVFPDLLYSIHNDNEKINEYRKMFNLWTDKQFLLNFFRKYVTFIDKDLWKGLDKDPEKAAQFVIQDAYKLEKYIKQLKRNIEKGKVPDFDSFFRPLDGKYVYEWQHVPMKAYGKEHNTMLRIYAIKMGENCYLVVCGGLKLAKTIQESPVLKDEVFPRIDRAIHYLKQLGIENNNDLQI